MYNFVLGWEATLKFSRSICLIKNLPLFDLEIKYKLIQLSKYLQNIDYRSHWFFHEVSSSSIYHLFLKDVQS